MHIGLIVGIGPTATDFYYRHLIAAAARKGRDLETTMAHADTPTLLRHQAAGNVAAQGLRRVGLIGTRVVMQPGFYGAIRMSKSLPRRDRCWTPCTTPMSRWPHAGT
jgi:aspartate/glutamate racemase